MLECADHTIYTGYTVNLEKRLIAHNQGTASKYTRARLPVTLVYSEAYSSKSEAMRREAALKRLSRADKLALINGS